MDVPPGTGGQVSRVLTDNAEAVAYLDGVGIRPGATLVLESISPFEGPVAVRVEGKVVPARRYGRPPMCAPSTAWSKPKA